MQSRVSVLIICVLLPVAIPQACENKSQCDTSVNKDRISINAECRNTAAEVNWRPKGDDADLYIITIQYNCYYTNGTKLSGYPQIPIDRSDGLIDSGVYTLDGVRCIFGGCIFSWYHSCWFTFTDTATCEVLTESISLPPDPSKLSSVAVPIESTSLIYSPSSVAVLTDSTSLVYCQPDSSKISTQKVIFEPSNACVSDSVIIMVIVLPLSVIILCGISVIGLLISMFMWKKRRHDENTFIYQHDLNVDVESAIHMEKLLKIKAFDELSATESLITIIHSLKLPSTTSIFDQQLCRGDKDDIIITNKDIQRSKENLDSISMMSEFQMSNIIAKGSVAFDGRCNTHTPLQNTTAIEEIASDDYNATERSYSANRLPLGLSRSVSSEYIQDTTTQSLKNEFLILNDELCNAIETDTIDLQTSEDSSSPFLHHYSSSDKRIRESPTLLKIEDASDNFSIVDTDSSYTDMSRHQWKPPLSPTSLRDGSGYTQCSLVSALTNSIDTSTVEPETKYLPVLEMNDHSSNPALDQMMFAQRRKKYSSKKWLNKIK